MCNNGELITLAQSRINTIVASTGRVMLSDFYSISMLQMHESVANLRNQATLEEKGATSPRIIIPTCITAVSRCTPFSSYFSICCQDQCVKYSHAWKLSRRGHVLFRRA